MDDNEIGCYLGDQVITGYVWPQCSDLVTTEAPTWMYWWGGGATALAVLLAALVVVLVARRDAD